MMKRWWLKIEKGHAQVTAPAAEGFLEPLSAEELLAADHRKKLLERIWEYTALSQPHFDQLYLEPIRRYANYVQQLPASESHHHAYPGGMLDHGLELVACSLKLRQSRLLPSGAAPEDQAAQADAWSAGIAYGALLHDVGKIAVDLLVEYLDGELWHPWHGPLNQPYRFRYRSDRDYKLHGAAAGLLYTKVLTPALLDWLSSYPTLWGCLLNLLANHYDYAGTLGELVLQADRISTAQNIGANPSKASQAPKYSLQHHLLSGLRHLVINEFKLNQPGASGWLTEDDLWLVSKTATDKLRAYLLSESIDGIPSSNIAMFDELQSHGLVEETSDGKAVWSATVSDDSWQRTFTFLRLQPSLIWRDDNRPQCFTGTVKPVTAPTEPANTHESASDQGRLPLEVKHPHDATPPAQDFDYVNHFMNLFSDEAENTEGRLADGATASEPKSHDVPGQEFLNWLRSGIGSHRLLVNDRKAKIHAVAGTFFLVSPGIFQLYIAQHPHIADTTGASDAWRRLQHDFERLEIHQKLPNGQNIWTCKVQGPRRSTSLNGYLLRDAVAACGNPPADNPFLRIDP